MRVKNTVVDSFKQLGTIIHTTVNKDSYHEVVDKNIPELSASTGSSKTLDTPVQKVMDSYDESPSEHDQNKVMERECDTIQEENNDEDEQSSPDLSSKDD